MGKRGEECQYSYVDIGGIKARKAIQPRPKISAKIRTNKGWRDWAGFKTEEEGIDRTVQIAYLQSRRCMLRHSACTPMCARNMCARTMYAVG